MASGMEARLEDVVKAVISVCMVFFSTRTGLKPKIDKMMKKSTVNIKSAERMVHRILMTESNALAPVVTNNDVTEQNTNKGRRQMKSPISFIKSLPSSSKAEVIIFILHAPAATPIRIARIIS